MNPDEFKNCGELFIERCNGPEYIGECVDAEKLLHELEGKDGVSVLHASCQIKHSGIWLLRFVRNVEQLRGKAMQIVRKICQRGDG